VVSDLSEESPLDEQQRLKEARARKVAWLIRDAQNARREAEERDKEQQRLKDMPLREAEKLLNVAGGPVWTAMAIARKRRRIAFITRDIIAMRPYHVTNEAITWKDCSLRKWLNTEFFDSLPEQVRSRVIEVTNQNPSRYVGPAVGPPTRDRVFLLSRDEAERYFPSNTSRRASFDDQQGSWWLRSPAGAQNEADLITEYGQFHLYGLPVDRAYVGVRPAVFISLDALPSGGC
jgi:hypothetical protein